MMVALGWFLCLKLSLLLSELVTAAEESRA